MQKTLSKLFLYVAMPALMTTGCATVNHIDTNTCKTWTTTATSRNIPLIAFSSSSKQKFSSSCDEGRTAAMTTLIGNDGKNLHPASAYIGQEFLKIKIEAIKNNKDTDYNKSVLEFYKFFLGEKGFKIDAISKALTPAPRTENPALTNNPNML